MTLFCGASEKVHRPALVLRDAPPIEQVNAIRVLSRFEILGGRLPQVVRGRRIVLGNSASVN